ncbi:hypothetical protein PBY51_023299 [Eleginops maclovinus]|uniref:Uncharacterized protein n=1 Tax=Eleginops maclovinus TaxID=56733 RepID=A0AAN8AE70_ELEMC|nr:hypothetical protein PBY51_023299 [Eleginops maclovinus]
MRGSSLQDSKLVVRHVNLCNPTQWKPAHPPCFCLFPDCLSFALAAWPLGGVACFPFWSIRGSACSEEGRTASRIKSEQEVSRTERETRCRNSITHG